MTTNNKPIYAIYCCFYPHMPMKNYRKRQTILLFFLTTKSENQLILGCLTP